MKQIQFKARKLSPYIYECEYTETYIFPLRKSSPIKLECFLISGAKLTFNVEGNPFESITLGQDSAGFYFRVCYNGKNKYWRLWNIK